MSEIKEIIANNLIKLRTQKKLTQSELAEKINYTDKSVSKWERGDTTPPIDVLKELADFYGITLDNLVTKKEDDFYIVNDYSGKENNTNKIIITALATSIIWLISTILFVYSSLLGLTKPWLLFIIATPCSILVLIIFNFIWGRRTYSFILISLLIWTMLATVYLTLIEYTPWTIFIIGVPLQVSIILWSQLKSSKVKKTNKKRLT